MDVLTTLNDIQRTLLRRRYGALRDAQLVQRAIHEVVQHEARVVMRDGGMEMDATSRVVAVIGTLTPDELRAQYEAHKGKRWSDEPMGADKMKSLFEYDGLLRWDVRDEFMWQAEAKLERLTKQGL